jgi:hypothetical protein
MSERQNGPRHQSADSNGGLVVLGACLLAGLWIAGNKLADAALEVKALERTVVVKGLAEREVPADIAIWPITFRVASNDLETLFTTIQRNNEVVQSFLADYGFEAEEISVAPPEVVDVLAQQYGNASEVNFRYRAGSTVTVYSADVAAVRRAMADTVELGKRGVATAGQDYENRTQFLFTGLSALKPEMIQDATTKARAVARKFAEDSDSRLGKIRRARQGQFSISDRDSKTPHIKKVRVVSTIEYYLVD